MREQLVEPFVEDGSAALRDGTVVRVRPIEPADATRLVRFHEALSSDTVRLRFFAVHPYLTSSELERFTNVDHVDREALVAVLDDELIGVGRYERLATRTDAEVAFVVADNWQGLGVGPILLGHLATRARAHDILRFEADTLVENKPMLTVFRRSGLVTSRATSEGVVHVSMLL